MIVTEFNPRHGRCSFTIESSEDLWTLRRIMSRGDVVVTRSSRVSKHEGEYSRPDKGERVKVTVALSVEEVHLDSSIERVRVKGTIIETSDESVSKAGSHSLTLAPGNSLTLKKEHWRSLDLKLVRSTKAASKRFLLVAIDRRDAGIGTLSGGHLSVLTTIESGLGGKMSEELNARPYYSKVVAAVSQSYRDGDEIVVAGPGNTKSVIANMLSSDLKKGAAVLEGFDLTGADGVRFMVKDPAFQKIAKGSILVEMQRLVVEVVKRISSGDTKVAFSLQRVEEAATAGAVEACAVSDDVFRPGVDEEELVEVLNTIEGKGGSVHLADSSLEIGKQVSAFGGIVALLRFPVRSY